PHPPSPPLFPYTTLFRSINRGGTGSSPTDKRWDRLFAALLPPPPAGQPAPEIREAPANQLAPVGAPPAPALAAAGAVSPEPMNARTPEPPITEQALNRSGTGLPGTNPSPPGEPVSADRTMVAASPAPPGGFPPT